MTFLQAPYGQGKQVEDTSTKGYELLNHNQEMVDLIISYLLKVSA